MNVFNEEINEKGERFDVNGKAYQGLYSDKDGKEQIAFQLPRFPLNRGDVVIRARDRVNFRVESTTLGKTPDGVVITFSAKVTR